MSQDTKTEISKQIARRVALEQVIAEMSDKYDSQASDYAKQLALTKLGKTQVRGLEILAYTTDKVSDITDWLKLRVGRDKERDLWAREGLGRELLTALEGLRNDAQRIVVNVKENYPLSHEDPDLERQVHLRLIQEYLKHFTAHFEYAKAKEEKKR